METLQADSDSEPEVLAARRIAQAAPGDGHAAEAELYRMLAPRVRRYGLRHLRDGRPRDPKRVVSFVLGTCRMTVMDQRRTELRREDLLQRYADAVPLADVSIAPRLDHAKVVDCLDRLPERERSVLVMTFYDEASSEDVGAQLGLSAGNVRVIRHRGIDRRRRCVEAGRRTP